MSSIDAQLVLSEVYQTTYGLYDHRANGNPSSPLKGACLHPKEDYITLGARHNFIRRFAICNVAKVSGMSYSEFIELTKDECDVWFEVCEHMSKAENAALNGAVNDMRNK